MLIDKMEATGRFKVLGGLFGLMLVFTRAEIWWSMKLRLEG